MKTLIVTLAVLVSCSAFATPTNFKLFKAQYPDFEGANCKICHIAPPQLNPYGMDLQKANLDFKSIEALDSDGDGATNLEEITAGSQPGNKDSTPAKP